MYDVSWYANWSISKIYGFIEGKKTVSARKELLVEQRKILVSKQEEIMKTIERLDYKISLYSEIEEGIRKDFTEEI